MTAPADSRAALQRLVEWVEWDWRLRMGDAHPSNCDALHDAKQTLATPPPAGDLAVAEAIVERATIWSDGPPSNAFRYIPNQSPILIAAITTALQAARAAERARIKAILDRKVDWTVGEIAAALAQEAP